MGERAGKGRPRRGGSSPKARRSSSATCSTPRARRSPRDLGDDGAFVKLDVTSEEAWQEAVDSTVDAFGGLHVLVNNAGVLGGFTPLARTPLDDFMRAININLVGTFLGMRTAVPAMRESGGGAIVNISSTAGHVGRAVRRGVHGEQVRRAGHHQDGRARVRPLRHPRQLGAPRGSGHRDDGRGRRRRQQRLLQGAARPARIGTVDDIANLVLFLASDESAYCTGTEFVIDGGMQAGDVRLLPPPK